MFRVARFSRLKQVHFFILFLWILLWGVPWGKYFQFTGNIYIGFFVDMICLGVSIGIFIIPGLLLYFLLKDKNDIISDSSGIISIGFTFSVLIIAFIGFMGRLTEISFTFVKSLFALIGLVELIIVMLIKPDFVVSKKYFLESLRGIYSNAPLSLALVLVTIMTFNDYLFFIDDTTYLAYMTHWQYATHLNFNNIIHQMNIIEIDRFWFALYPMGQALLSDLSGVPGILLLSNYLELFLVPIALITSYWFARILGLTPRVAGFSVLIQISMYTWMIGEQWPVGTWFYQSMSEDKVSAVFLLAPVFFAFVLRFIRSPVKRNLILVFLSGGSLTFTHPVILFFACIIASGLALFSWISKKTGWYEVLQLAIVIFSLMMPFVIIRLYSVSSGFSLDAHSASVSYEIDKYTNVINNVFYGLNPGVLQFFDLPPESSAYNVFQFIRPFPFALMLLAGIFALAKLKKGPFYWYILTCVLLIVFATVPYTGWILGYFTDARLISRASWFSPLGLGGVLVVMFVVDWLKRVCISWKTEKKYTAKLRNGNFVGLVVCFVFISPMLIVGSVPRVPFYFEVLNHNKQLAQIGAYIDQDATSQSRVIALDYWDTQLLPGVSARADLISFRQEKDENGHNYFLTADDIHERIFASDAIRSLDVLNADGGRCSLLEKFDVRYVIAQAENTESYIGALEICKRSVEKIYQTKDLTLLKLK